MWGLAALMAAFGQRSALEVTAPLWVKTQKMLTNGKRGRVRRLTTHQTRESAGLDSATYNCESVLS